MEYGQFDWFIITSGSMLKVIKKSLAGSVYVVLMTPNLSKDIQCQV